MTRTEPAIAAEFADLVARAQRLTPQIAKMSLETDANNVDPTESMRLIWEEGLWRINVPTAFGGLSDGRIEFALDTFGEICVALGRGDGSVNLNWCASSAVTREVFASSLPDATKTELAETMRQGTWRMVASNSETGIAAKATGRRVDGGVIISGQKSFNTNSGDAGIAKVLFVMDGVTTPHHALIPLDDPKVIKHHDWNVMGMRGTQSQTITYDDVFVADNWFWEETVRSPAVFLMALQNQSCIMLGPAYGAFDAGLEYVRRLDRPTVRIVDVATDDPFVRHRLGVYASRLAAAKALLLEVAREIEESDENSDQGELVVRVQEVLIMCKDTSHVVTDGLFELTGTRSTATKYGMDRFWRNSRTFGQHDPKTDALYYWIGSYYLTGEPPGREMLVRV